MNLEALSLDLDMLKMSKMAGPDQIVLDGSDKGRYTTIEDAIAYVMRSIHPELRAGLVVELLDSFDEGIRWAVAAQFDHGLPGGKIGDDEALQVFRLLTDTHPWVIRESLTTMARADLMLSGLNLQQLAAKAIAAVGRAEAQGWPRSELMPDIASLVTSAPAFAEHIDLTTRG